MPGFDFRHRLSGGRPTVRQLMLRDGERLTQGDMLNWEDGRVDLGAGGDTKLVGVAQETVDGEAGKTVISVVTDADAVYAVDDPHARVRGDQLGLDGTTGRQGVASSGAAQLVVVLDSEPDAETLVRIDSASHYRYADQGLERPTGGELNAAVARAVVRYHNEHLGRGPTRARAFYRDNVLVVILQDAMTRAERSLTASGRADAVYHLRAAFQDTMGPDLIATVESLTGCKVEAFLSSTHLDPDVAAEVFLLDRPIGEPEGAG